MWVLVLWLQSKETSILDKKQLKYVGESVQIKFRKKWLDVKVIAENGKFYNLQIKNNHQWHFSYLVIPFDFENIPKSISICI